MDARLTLALVAALALSADISGLAPFRTAPTGLGSVGSSARAPVYPAVPEPAADVQAPGHPSKTLQPESRLLLVRYVDGEFAKAMQSIPGGKKGFKVAPGKTAEKQTLSDALRLYGVAAVPGDTVQITGVEFRAHEIVLRINGGGKKHFHWREHVQVGVGNVETPPPASVGPPQITGATLILDYGREVPDMSPDDLKRDLSMWLDFSKQPSATVNWVDTLPPQFQDAIKDHRAIVGMDQDMVVAALGRPDKKVRERDPEGVDTEDWIYGTPPSKTTFVTFAGDNVIRVKVFD